MLSPKNPYQRITPLFKDTHLLEFGAWFDQNEANAAFALIFSMMYEQRLSDFQVALKDGKKPPICVALLEEAHRIIPAHTGGGDEHLIPTAQAATGLFTQMIAECRALGQGLIIGEQSASKIDPNVLINTSTKIIHPVLYRRDKEFLSSELALSPSEQNSLANLRVGEALAFMPDTYQPLQIRVPEFGREGG